MSNHLYQSGLLALRLQRKPFCGIASNATGGLQKLQYVETGKRYNSTKVNTTRAAYLSNDVQQEVDHHSKLDNQWWDTNGPVKALHSLNSIRVPFIRDGLIARGQVPKDLVQTPNVLLNQKILEIGCGGGILTEQLARLGASIIALDLSENLIRVAREHLLKGDPQLSERIQYKIEPIELHSKENQNVYDAVVISEVLEHIEDKVGFLTASVQCLKPGGSVFVTTLSKTFSMWFLGVFIGEYVLNALPVGTHHYGKMITPLECQRILDTMGCQTVLVNGSMYDFFKNRWHWINSNNLFYALQAVKGEI